jgi:hypothetical protein
MRDAFLPEAEESALWAATADRVMPDSDTWVRVLQLTTVASPFTCRSVSDLAPLAVMVNLQTR